MKLPFTIDEFLGLFEKYNLSVWPIQFIFLLAAIISLIILVKERPSSSRIIFSILSFFWLWMGVVYHMLFFSTINRAAYFFGFLFIVQGCLFLYYGVIRGLLQLKFEPNLPGITGSLLIIYAIIIYPILGYLFGHIYPRSPTFGVPCPTTIFSFGILLFSVNRVPWYVLIIPFLWSIIGFSAAVNLSVKEDFGLVLAGILSTAILLFHKNRSKSNRSIAGNN